MRQATFPEYVADAFTGSSMRRAVTWSFALALVLACVKMAFFLPSESMTALWEETSIYLNGYHLPLGTYLLYPDAGYINVLPKLAAFMVLRLLGLAAIYPLAFKFASLFLAAFGLMIFASGRFACVAPSILARLAFCIYIFLFPEHDFFAPYNASYFLVFLLIYYLFVLIEAAELDGRVFLFIVLTAPVAVLAKPVFFLFGPVFFLLLLGQAHSIMKGGQAERYKTAAIAWIVLLYAFQFFHTLHFYPDLGQSAVGAFVEQGGLASRVFLLLKQFVIFMGYGLAAPLNVAHSAKLAAPLFAAVGLLVIAALVANTRAQLRSGHKRLLLLSGTLLACCFFSIVGIFKNTWLYQCSFSDYLFTRPWDHRHLFSFVVFSNIQVLTYVERASRGSWAGWRRVGAILPAVYGALAFLSLCLLNPHFFGPLHKYALTWAEARTLLAEQSVFIPIPQIMPEWLPRHEFATPSGLSGKYTSRLWGLMYSPTCNWASGIAEATQLATPGQLTGTTGGTAFFRHAFAVKDRKVKYLLLFPQQADNVFLSENSFLTVSTSGSAVRGRLVNAGPRRFFLFVLDVPVASQDTTEFTITTPSGYPPRTDFSLMLVGNW